MGAEPTVRIHPPPAGSLQTPSPSQADRADDGAVDDHPVGFCVPRLSRGAVDVRNAGGLRLTSSMLTQGVLSTYGANRTIDAKKQRQVASSGGHTRGRGSSALEMKIVARSNALPLIRGFEARRRRPGRHRDDLGHSRRRIASHLRMAAQPIRMAAQRGCERGLRPGRAKAGERQRQRHCQPLGHRQRCVALCLPAAIRQRCQRCLPPDGPNTGQRR